MPKRTRSRQLARQHQQRREQRMRQHRKRQTATIAVALVIALVGAFVAVAAFAGGDDVPPAATGETGGAQETEEPSVSPPPAGSQTSTVEPQPGPEEVACGGSRPEGALKPKPQFSAPKQVLKPSSTYTAEMQTSCGTIVIELLAEQAPQTVNSFAFLARQGYFDGQRIHRIDTSIDVIQGGDPTGTGTGGPGYSIPDELAGAESYGPGVLAMANAGPNTGGSQFFVVTGEDGHMLDDQAAWTIFGTVVEGLDVAKRIQGLEVQDPGGGLEGQQPAAAVYVESVRIRRSS